MNYTDLRLKVRHFLKNNKTILLLVVLVWGVVFYINLLLGNKKVDTTPETTLDTHTSVIDSADTTPKRISNQIEPMIEEYVGYCNDGNYQKAFDMLSDDCKKYAFNNDVVELMRHVLTKMPTPKKYSIQNYSTINTGDDKYYVYEIKYIDDLLSTGLTNSNYAFTSENLTFHEVDNKLVMEAGNYIYHKDIKSISENEYLKIDVVDKIVNYSIETYKIKFTNRSNYTIVIQDGQEDNEIALSLTNELRKCSDINSLVLKPGETTQLDFVFPKFIDDGDQSIDILFSSIRVMEQYSGNSDEIPKEVRQSEIDNAISKFSMQVSVK